MKKNTLIKANQFNIYKFIKPAYLSFKNYSLAKRQTRLKFI